VAPVRLNDPLYFLTGIPVGSVRRWGLTVGDESGDLGHALVIEGMIMEELIRRLDNQVDEIQLQLVTIRDLRSKLLETADEINGRRLG
jgi:hypothetical protein